MAMIKIIKMDPTCGNMKHLILDLEIGCSPVKCLFLAKRFKD